MMLQNKIIALEKQQIIDLADGYFQRICGDPLAMDEEQRNIFLEEIKKAQTHVLQHMEPMIICSYFGVSKTEQAFELSGKVRLTDEKAVFQPTGLEEICLTGDIFRYYGQFPIKGILIYLLTIGELHKSEDMKLLQQYYIDAWGSAYVEAAHDLLKKELIQMFHEKSTANGINDKFFVSEPFGPGYFGIAVDATKALFAMLAYEKLHLNLSAGGMMQPEKSCSGFYVISTEDIPFPQDHCASCQAKKNCEYCRKRNV